MKAKLTLLLFILPFLSFAQGPWEFNTASDTEGWVGATTQVNSATASTTTVAQSGTSLIVQTTAAAAGRNPNINKPLAGIAIATSNRLEIRLKNNSLAVFIRFWVTIDGGALNTNNIVPGIAITASDATFKTYVADLSGVASTATITQIYLEFKTGTSPSGTNYTPAAPAPTIEIDYIRPFKYVTPTRNVFDFNTAADVEGFTTLTRATAVQATDGVNGTLKMTATAGTLDAKVALNASTFTVDGTSNKYAHVTLKNSSTNTRFILTASSINYLPFQTYTTGDGSYKTYDFNLSSWTGNQQPEFAFSVQTTWLAIGTYVVNDVVVFQNSNYKNLTGANSGTGLNPKTDNVNWVLVGTEGALLDITNSIFIDKIEFDNNPGVLPTKFGTIQATYKNQAVEVNWNTYNESNLNGYYVQRSKNGIQFDDLSFVTAQNALEATYDYIDRSSFKDNILYYRIKGMDTDGKTTYSAIAKISLLNSSKEGILMMNPVRGSTLQMQLNGMKKGTYHISLRNLMGANLSSNKLNIQNTTNSASLNLPANLPKGIYVVTITGEGYQHSRKVLVE